MARQFRDPLLKRAAALASRDCLAPDTAEAALCFWVGKAAASMWRPKAVIMLYEGHAWERCLSWGIKSATAECRAWWVRIRK